MTTPALLEPRQGLWGKSSMMKMFPTRKKEIEDLFQKEVLVQWLGWPAKYNQWIPEEEVRELVHT